MACPAPPRCHPERAPTRRRATQRRQTWAITGWLNFSTTCVGTVVGCADAAGTALITEVTNAAAQAKDTNATPVARTAARGMRQGETHEYGCRPMAERRGDCSSRLTIGAILTAALGTATALACVMSNHLATALDRPPTRCLRPRPSRSYGNGFCCVAQVKPRGCAPEGGQGVPWRGAAAVTSRARRPAAPRLSHTEQVTGQAPLVARTGPPRAVCTPVGGPPFERSTAQWNLPSGARPSWAVHIS